MTMFRVVSSAVLSCTVGFGCMPPADEPAPGVPRSCEVAPGGAPWDVSEPEAMPGYEDTLASIRTDALPEWLDTTEVDALTLATLAYALEIPVWEIQDSLDLTRLDDVDPRLGAAVAAAIAVTGGDGIDRDLLRRGLHRYYACDRQLPDTLDAFVDSFGDYRQWARREIEDSVPKTGLRTLYENPEAGVFVAEGANDGGVEIEVILQGHRRDEALEFFAYGSDGELVDRTRLAVGSEPSVLPAPFTCALCHRDLDSNTFSRVEP